MAIPITEPIATRRPAPPKTSLQMDEVEVFSS